MKFNYMEGLIVYPKNSFELDSLQSLLVKMKISFEKTEVKERMILTEAQKESIKEGLKAADENDFYSEEEANKIIEECFK